MDLKIIFYFLLSILLINPIFSDMVLHLTEEDFTGENIMVKDGFIQLAYTDYGLNKFLKENEFKLQKISIEEKRSLDTSKWMRIRESYYKILNLNEDYIEKIYICDFLFLIL